MPRLYREAPLNSIWEGSGNVNALDLLRALAKQPASLDAYAAEVALARGGDARLDRAARAVFDALSADRASLEAEARRVVERMALVLQASLLVRHAPGAVADAFCATRLGAEGGVAFGTLPARVGTRAIVDRAWPA